MNDFKILIVGLLFVCFYVLWLLFDIRKKKRLFISVLVLFVSRKCFSVFKFISVPIITIVLIILCTQGIFFRKSIQQLIIIRVLIRRRSLLASTLTKKLKIHMV